MLSHVAPILGHGAVAYKSIREFCEELVKGIRPVVILSEAKNLDNPPDLSLRAD
jgi:hypothetical protein